MSRNGTILIGGISIVIIAIISLIRDRVKEITGEEILIPFTILLMVAALVVIFLVFVWIVLMSRKKRRESYENR